MSAEPNNDRRPRSYHRSLARAVYGMPLIIVTACFVWRAFDNNWPDVAQITFGGLVLLVGAAVTYRAFRTGIDVASSGVAIVNLLRTERLEWDEVKGFDISRDGLWRCIVVTSREGKRIPVAGLRLWGGDANVLAQDLEGLRREQATAKGA